MDKTVVSMIALITRVNSFTDLNNWGSEVGGVVIHLGQGQDSKKGEETIKNMPENGVGIMDNGATP